MISLTSDQHRTGVFSVLFAVALLLASAAVFLWSHSDSPFKTWILAGEIVMLFCVSVMPFILGSSYSCIFFMVSSSMVASLFWVDYYTTPLSGIEVARLSQSECMKEHAEYRIKIMGPVNREGMMAVKATCEFVAKTKTAHYQNEKELAAQQRKKTEDDQLSALGASRN